MAKFEVIGKDASQYRFRSKHRIHLDLTKILKDCPKSQYRFRSKHRIQ